MINLSEISPEELEEDQEFLENALAYRAESPEDAVKFLDALEGIYEGVKKAEPDADEALAGWENYMMTWAHRNAAVLPPERYHATIERVEARQPLGWTRRLFELSPLPPVARFIGELAEHPPGVVDPLSTHPEFQPLVEIELLETAYSFLTGSGIRPGDRLVVHLGSFAYEGALVIVSCEFDPEPPEKWGVEGLMTARIVALESEEHGLRFRLLTDDEKVVEAPRGVMNVECVIFNRPDVLDGSAAS